jgi:hypothetical protein
MQQKNWIITGLLAIVAMIGLTILTSSSSTDKLAPTDKTTCSKLPIKDCSTQDNDQGIIHESLSRQFL